MNLIDYFALMPLLILFGVGLVLLLLETFSPTKKGLLSLLTVVGISAALFASAISPAAVSPLLTPWLLFDAFARFFSLLFLSIGLITALISSPFFTRFEASRGEYYFFLLSSLFGLLLISSANDFLTLFLGLETLSISLYVLCGYMKSWSLSHEAAFKYFLLGSISTSFLLFGIALVYGATGSTSFQALHVANKTLFMTGLALILVSLLRKRELRLLNATADGGEEMK